MPRNNKMSSMGRGMTSGRGMSSFGSGRVGILTRIRMFFSYNRFFNFGFNRRSGSGCKRGMGMGRGRGFRR